LKISVYGDLKEIIISKIRFLSQKDGKQLLSENPLFATGKCLFGKYSPGRGGMSRCESKKHS
jgi:hypothetical protein